MVGADDGKRPLRRRALLVPLAAGGSALVLCGLALFRSPDRVEGFEVLTNGSFDAWTPAGSPQSWSALSGSFAEETVDTLGGSAAGILRAGPTTVVIHSAVEAPAGSTLSGSVYVKGPDSATLRIQYRYLDAGFATLSTVVGPAVAASGSYSVVSFSGAVAPAGAEWVHFEIFIGGTGDVLLENASLDITAAAPTPTPSPEPPTATATAGVATNTATATAGGGGTPGTAVPTATRTATPTRTPTGTRTPSPTPPPTATRTPTPPQPGSPTAPLPTSTPTFPAGSGYGGLLSNGDFELVRDGKPAYWEKFGGTMSASGEAARGTYAGCLVSDTDSTKWLYQVVVVEEGRWYAAEAKVRVTSGMGSIRISWYASADGSGAQLSQAAGEGSTSAGWVSVGTGPVQAAASARSARVRLVLQPSGTSTACFDDAAFGPTSAPPAATATTAPTGVATGPIGATSAPPSATATSLPRPGLVGATPARPGAPAESAAAGALRISEIMSDPPQTGRDAAYEWVELVNVGAEPVDLLGWRISDATSADLLPATAVPAGGYVVIAGGGASFVAGVTAVLVGDGEIGNGLGNAGDVLRLTAPDGTLVDEVSYGNNVKVFEPAPPAPGPGGTLGAKDPASDPASENWALTLRATPGEPNLFPPRAASTPAASASSAATAAPARTGPGIEVTEDDGDGSVGGWLVLGAVGGISLGIAGAALAPRARSWRGRNNGG